MDYEVKIKICFLTTTWGGGGGEHGCYDPLN